MNLHGAVLLTAGALVLAGGEPDPVKKELANLQGTWQTVSVEIDGEPLRGGFKGDRMEIKGEGFLLVSRLGNVGGVLKVDPTKRPKTIDTETIVGENKGTKALGIYVLDGDKLTVCYAPEPNPRPTEFRTTPKSGRSLVVYKRVKK
jgi:uncharacterized protein (TIGR03067 family)